jgi:hypothetical protein
MARAASQRLPFHSSWATLAVLGTHEEGGNPMEWATLPLKRYAEFSGRSRRKE